MDVCRVKEDVSSIVVRKTGGDHQRSLPMITAGGHSDTDTRRMQKEHDHANGPDDCGNYNDVYCWLKCLDLSPNDVVSVQMHLNDEESLYCLDPSTLKACAYGGVAGGGG